MNNKSEKPPPGKKSGGPDNFVHKSLPHLNYVFDTNHNYTDANATPENRQLPIQKNGRPD